MSALDVSVQAQVLNLMARLQEELRLGYVFVSHDLAVVHHIADGVLVMYLGHAVERGGRDAIFGEPQHPYTAALLDSVPAMAGSGTGRRRRVALSGELPSPLNPPRGCVFSTRCPHAIERCHAERPATRAIDGRQVACHLAERFLEPGRAGAGESGPHAPQAQPSGGSK